MDWINIEYLKNGTSNQKLAYENINDLNILEILRKYNPVLVGTIPINIDIVGSDLDIICNVNDFVEFRRILNNNFAKHNHFIINDIVDNDSRVITVNFQYRDFEFEIYGVSIPTINQNAFRHMVIEHRILMLANSMFREEILTLKKDGFKTEPAFAKLLKLKGNPYDALLKLEDCDDESILILLRDYRTR